MRSLPALLRSKPLRQLVRSRKPSAALQWIPWDDVIMLTSFLLSCQGLRESFYWPLRQSKTKQAEIENWMFMDRNPVMLWFNFTSAKDDCFCNLAVWLTETQEKNSEGRLRSGGKKKIKKIGRIFQIHQVHWAWKRHRYVFKGQQPFSAGQWRSEIMLEVPPWGWWLL